jgi:hypothetical protein
MNETQRRLMNAQKYDAEIYVGPGWIREGRREERKLITLPHRKLQKAGSRNGAERELRNSGLWCLLIPAGLFLAVAACLFKVIWNALQ